MSAKEGVFLYHEFKINLSYLVQNWQRDAEQPSMGEFSALNFKLNLFESHNAWKNMIVEKCGEKHLT